MRFYSLKILIWREDNILPYFVMYIVRLLFYAKVVSLLSFFKNDCHLKRACFEVDILCCINNVAVYGISNLSLSAFVCDCGELCVTVSICFCRNRAHVALANHNPNALDSVAVCVNMALPTKRSPA